MTAARRHLRLRTAHWRRRCERCLVFVGVLLPIPLFAASGLSLPLPATVERLAAALVPWADAANTGNQLAARGPGGSIVRVSGEQEDGASYPPGASASAGGGRTSPAKDGATGAGTPGVSAPAEDADGDQEGAPAEGGTAQEPTKPDRPRGEPIRGADPTQPPPLPPLPAPPAGPADPVVPIQGEVNRRLDDVTDAVNKLLPPVVPPVTPPVVPPVLPQVPPVLPGLGR